MDEAPKKKPSPNAVHGEYGTCGTSKLDALKRLGLVPGKAGSATPDETNSLAEGDAGKTIGRALSLKMGYGKVNEASLAAFLEAYGQCGIIVRAAAVANLSYSSIQNQRKKDPDFDALCIETKEKWIADYLDDPIRKIGIDGLPKYALGGKDRNERIEVSREVSPQVTLAYARKFDPAYREKQEIDVNHQGGVLVVHAPATDPESWRKKFESEPEIVADSPPGSSPA